MKLKLSVVALVLLLIIAGFVCIKYYSYVFARDVHGEIVDVERVNQNTAIISANGSAPNAAAMFSFAVAIRDDKGEIVTASSEDRQWAVVHKGQCAEAKFFPYPFWQMDKAGTFHDARLLKLYDCPGKTPTTLGDSAPTG